MFEIEHSSKVIFKYQVKNHIQGDIVSKDKLSQDIPNNVYLYCDVVLRSGDIIQVDTISYDKQVSGILLDIKKNEEIPFTMSLDTLRELPNVKINFKWYESKNTDWDSNEDISNVNDDTSNFKQGFKDFEQSSFYHEASKDEKLLYNKIMLLLSKLQLHPNTINIYNTSDKYNFIKGELQKIIKSKKPELLNNDNDFDNDLILYMIIMYSAILNGTDVYYIYQNRQGNDGITKFNHYLESLLKYDKILIQESIFSKQNAYDIFGLRARRSDTGLMDTILKNCHKVLKENDFGYSDLRFPMDDRIMQESLIKKRDVNNIPRIATQERYQPIKDDEQFSEEQIKEKLQKAIKENNKDLQKHFEELLVQKKKNKKPSKQFDIYFKYEKPITTFDELVEYYYENLKKISKTGDLSELKDNLLNFQNNNVNASIRDIQDKFKTDFLAIYTKGYSDENTEKFKNLNKSKNVTLDNKNTKLINKTLVKSYRNWYNTYFEPVFKELNEIDWFDKINTIEPTINRITFDKKFKMLTDSAYKKYISRKKNEEQKRIMSEYRTSSKFKIKKSEDENENDEDKPVKQTKLFAKKQQKLEDDEMDQEIDKYFKELNLDKTSDDLATYDTTSANTSSESDLSTEDTTTSSSDYTPKIKTTRQPRSSPKLKTPKNEEDDLLSSFKQLSINENKNENEKEEMSKYFFSKKCDGKGGFKLKELQDICKKLKLKVSGKKDDLCKRIKDYFNVTEDSNVTDSNITESQIGGSKNMLETIENSESSNDANDTKVKAFFKKLESNVKRGL